MYLLLPVVDKVSLLLDRVEERVGQCVLGGDAFVGVELQHRGQQLQCLGAAGGETLREVL